MSLLCTCPLPSELTSIPESDCPENFGQIQKVVFQRASGAWVFDSGVPATGVLVQASWTALLAETDNTKIVVSPFLEDAKISRGDAITRGGGDNTTLNGVEKVMGAQPALFTAELTSIQNATIDAMKTLQCEDLVVAFINEFGQIILKKISGTQYNMIPIQSLFVTDADSKGYATDDQAMLRFGLKYGWRTGTEIVKPTWNPLTVLVNP